MYRRLVEKQFLTALADTRVVLLNGARQTGKSALVQQLAAQRGGRYLTLDDPAATGLARSDPSAMVREAGHFMVIDEAQQGPEQTAAAQSTLAPVCLITLAQRSRSARISVARPSGVAPIAWK